MSKFSGKIIKRSKLERLESRVNNLESEIKNLKIQVVGFNHFISTVYAKFKKEQAEQEKLIKPATGILS